MNFDQKREKILEQMRAITRMERSKLCCQSRGRRDFRFYKLQSWENGRNYTRYVNAKEADQVKEDVANYRRFCKLAAQFVALTVAQTRRESQRVNKPSP